MSRTSTSSKKPGVDACFASGAIVSIVCIQLHESNAPEERLLFSLLVAIGYLLASKFLAGMPIAKAAGRAYLLCFITGIVGLVATGSQLLNELHFQSQVEEFRDTELFQQLLKTFVQVLPHFFVPLITGISVYAVFSVYDDGMHAANKDVTSLLNQLERWMKDHRTPELVKQFLAETHSGLTQLQNQYQQLASVAQGTHQQIAEVGRSASAVTSSFSELRRSAQPLSQELATVRSQLVAAQANLGQLRAAVSEIDNVVNEFADIASHKILEHEN